MLTKFHLSERPPRIITSILLVLLFNAICIPGQCQTSRYWSLNLSAESALLGGIVAAGNGGTAGIYYNPATISYQQNGNLAFNSNLFTTSSYSAKDFFGEGRNFETSDFHVQPRFFSLLFKHPKNDKISLEVTALSRDFTNFDIFRHYDLSTDFSAIYPGDESYNATLELLNDYTDNWYGFGGSVQATTKFSFGFSTFISIKNLNDQGTRSVTAYTLQDTIFVASAHMNTRYEFSNTRLLFKFGVLYSIGPVDLGLNITTASLNISGKGNSFREVVTANIPKDSLQGFHNDISVSALEEGMNAQIKDPFSISFGINYLSKNKRTSLSFTTEYFGQIDPYKMFDSENPTVTYSPGFSYEGQDFLSTAYGANSVLNWGIGFSQQVGPATSLLGGFRSDQDFLKDYDFGDLDELGKISSLHFDVTHFSLGARFSINKFDLLFGGVYSRSREDRINQVIDFDPEDPEEGDLPLTGAISTATDFKYDSFGLYLGFTINFHRGANESD